MLRIAIASPPSSSVTTTARRWIPPVDRMATFGWLMMGKP
jgi:hypothetical protein